MSTEYSAAADILEEETGIECHVCRTRIEESPNRCDTCQYECHDCCMVHSNDKGEICLSCEATQDQINENSQMAELTQEIPEQQDHEPTCTSTREAIQCPTNQAICMGQDGIKIAKSPMATGVVRENTQNSEPSQRNDIRVKDKKNPDSLNVKQRELRQLENKLKKWEDDLKLKEAKAGCKNEDSRKLEDYLQRTEARNVELEATIRTLQRKICLLEKGIPIAANPPGPPDMNYGGLVQNNGYMGCPEVNSSNGNVPRKSEDLVNRSNNELIRGIHKQVTSFVLKKVSQPISALENLDNLLQNQQELNQSTPVLPNFNRDVNSKIPDYEQNFNPQQMTNLNPSFNPLQRTDFNKCFNAQQRTYPNSHINSQQNGGAFNCRLNNNPK